MIMSYKEYKQDVLICKKIHKKYGKSFYFGTFFFSPEQHDETCILYAFFRYPDEYVDTDFSDKKDIALSKLERWNNLWHKIYDNETIEADEEELAILRASAYVFHKYNIPFDYSQSFLSAMIQDTKITRYDTYTDLEKYMYGSASVVGLMMTYIMCSEDESFLNDKMHKDKVLYYAQSLGEAFQMTNFLRDIDDDMKTRGRIYLPLEDMRKFNVKEEDILNKKMSPEFISLIKYEIDRTQRLYREADIGLELLPKKPAKGVKVARVLYSKILDKIEEINYNVFDSRVSIGFYKKIFITLKLLIKIK